MGLHIPFFMCNYVEHWLCLGHCRDPSAEEKTPAPWCRATATELVTRGYTVVLACRSEEAAKEAAKGMQSQAGSAQVIATVDLASPDSIKSFADTFKGKFSRLDLLVNNAGCNFVPDWYTPSGVLGIVQVCLFTSV